MSALFQATLVLLAAALPGIALARRLRERLAWGACLALGAHAALLSFFPALGGRGLVFADVALAALLLAPVPGGPRPSRRVSGRTVRWLRRRKLEAFVVLGVFAAFAVLSVRHESPRGWDPSFHCLLVEKLAAGVRPLDWEPWEPVSVHYSLGADALVAHVVRATTTEETALFPHEAFVQCFPFAYALVAWTALGAFRRATRSRLAAVFGVAALAFLGAEFRLIYHWGGLPTVLGIALALAAAEAPSALAAGLVLGALPYLHHLTALIAWSSALVLALVLRERAILKALGIATLAALPLVPRAIAAAGGAGSTSIFRFEDEPMRPLLDYVWCRHGGGWGPFLLVLAGLGTWKARRRPRAPLAVLAYLVAMTIFLDVAYRLLARAVLHVDASALTPSRWMQLASVPLAALAGLGARRLFFKRRYALLGVVTIGVASIPFTDWEYRSKQLDPMLFDIGYWARAHLPDDAFVVVRARDKETQELGLLPDRDWWPYLLDRETDATPLPASEPRLDPRVLAKRALAHDPDASRAYARSRGKKLFWLGFNYMPPVPGARRMLVYPVYPARPVVALDEDTQ